MDYQPLDFLEHPLEFLWWANPAMRKGQLSPHKWQMRASKLIGTPKVFTKETPLQLLLPAANGSGKDALVVSPTALWFACSQIRSRCIITSSSHIQMQRQTQSYIRTWATMANQRSNELGLGEDLFTIQKDYIHCPRTGSEIVMFVTDEGGRAEGYHPFPDYPDGKVMIIINEAKTVLDELFEHLSRCTYAYWLEVSTPGHTNGHFYRLASGKRTISYPAPFQLGKRYLMRVTSYDCPHIPRQKIEDDKADWGESSPIFRSKHLAEFTSEGESVVIPRETCNSLKDYIQELRGQNKVRSVLFKETPMERFAGLDLAAGGDENALYIFDGNYCIGREVFRITDTNATVQLLVEFFQKWQLKEDCIIADHGGVGIGMLDNLRDNGKYNVHRVFFQGAARNKAIFANRAAEIWFNLGRFIQEQLIVLPHDDEALWTQLGERYYTQAVNGKIKLETKHEAKANGRPSPDRADAVALAFSLFTIQDIQQPKQTRSPRQFHVSSEELAQKVTGINKINYSGLPTREELAAAQDNIGKSFQGKGLTSVIRSLHGSRKNTGLRRF